MGIIIGVNYFFSGSSNNIMRRFSCSSSVLYLGSKSSSSKKWTTHLLMSRHITGVASAGIAHRVGILHCFSSLVFRGSLWQDPAQHNSSQPSVYHKTQDLVPGISIPQTSKLANLSWFFFPTPLSYVVVGAAFPDHMVGLPSSLCSSFGKTPPPPFAICAVSTALPSSRLFVFLHALQQHTYRLV